MIKENGFAALFKHYTWEHVSEKIYAKTQEDVLRVLQKSRLDLDDFSTLLSPAAAPFIEVMARKSQDYTLQRFGKVLQLYAPLYLSNECQNICTYCGFSLDNKIPRKTLTDQEILAEVKVLKQQGFDHILLVTGEAQQRVGVPYIKHAVELIKPFFSHISIEVQPLDENEYKILIDSGVHAVLVYQETYNEKDYKIHHPKGKKSNFQYRLETPDRLGSAGVHKIGLGALLGLEDWRVDAFFTALHLNYLERTYWKTKYSISFPRLRPHAGGLEPKVEITDRELVQLICAFRLFNQEVELSLSTREHEIFRNNVMKLGITTLSAGSKTNPGGYSSELESLEQFEISDERPVADVVRYIGSQGYEVVWKDWDPVLSKLN